MCSTPASISRKASVLRHVTALALIATGAPPAAPCMDEFPIGIFSHLCETPTLHRVLRPHILSVATDAESETRHDETVLILADHAFRHARIRVELYPVPGSDEVLALESEEPLAKGADATALLRVRLEEESVIVETGRAPTAVVPWRRETTALILIEVRDGKVRVTVPGEEDGEIWSREVVAELGAYLAIPTGGDSYGAERCGPTALDIFGDADEADRWLDDVGEEWTGRRLIGLERLIGFQHLGDPLDLRYEVSTWIPPRLSAKDQQPTPTLATGTDDRETSLTIQDFRLPGSPEALDVTLRQVVDTTHPRIAEQYWAIYSRGRLSDLWFFSPIADRNQAKMLAPYEIQEVVDDGNGEVVFRTCGEMHRPGGYGWIQGKDFVFSGPDYEGLGLLHVGGDFYINYDSDGTVTASVEASIAESEARPSLEARTVDADPVVLEYCGYEDPTMSEGDFTCEQWRKIAHCIVGQDRGSASVGQTWEPSWIEIED